MDVSAALQVKASMDGVSQTTDGLKGLTAAAQTGEKAVVSFTKATVARAKADLDALRASKDATAEQIKAAQAKLTAARAADSAARAQVAESAAARAATAATTARAGVTAAATAATARETAANAANATSLVALSAASAQAADAKVWLASSTGALLGKLTALAAAYLTVRGAIGAGDNWSDMQSRVGAAIGDMDAAADTMSRLVDVANASYSPLAQTVDVYARNVAVLRDLGRGADEAADFTEALNHALVITATKGQDAEVVQNALSRAIATGTLRAMEYETIMSRSPRVLQAIADEAGTTLTGLRALATEGKITGEVIASALTNSLADLRAEAAEMPATVGDAFVRIGTNIGYLVGIVDQASAGTETLAGSLIWVADSIKTLADADLTGVMSTAHDAMVLVAQASLVLAATRIPALVGATYALSASFVAAGASSLIFNARIVAGLLAMRTATTAAIIYAGALRGLAAMVALAGGPWGILAAGIALAGVALYRWMTRTPPLISGLEQVTAAQEALNASLESYRTGAPGAIEQAREYAQVMERTALSALAAAQAQLVLAKAEQERRLASAPEWINRAVNEGGAQIPEVAEAAERVRLIQDELENARMTLAALSREQAESGAQGVRAVREMAQEHRDLITSFERRAELARLEMFHGRQSAEAARAQVRHAREDLEARLATANATRVVVDATLAAFDAATRAEQATASWRDMTEDMRQKAQETHRILREMANADVGDSFMSRGIARLAEMARLALEAAAGVDALSLDAAGNPTGFGPGSAARRGAPGRPFELGLPGYNTRSGGGSGRDEAAEEARRQAEAIQEVIRALEAEIMLVGQSETARRTYQALQQAGVELYSEEGQRIADLVERLSELEQIQEHAQRGREAVLDLFMALGQGSDAAMRAIAQLLLEMARVQMMQGLLGLGGKGGGIFSFLGSLLTGGAVKNANGGVYNSPSLSAYSGQVHNTPQVFAFANGGVPGSNVGVFGEAGEEAIMPLSRGPDGKLGVKAQGGGAVTLNYSPTINAPGASAADIAAIRQAIAEDRVNFEARTVQAVRQAKQNRMLT